MVVSRQALSLSVYINGLYRRTLASEGASCLPRATGLAGSSPSSVTSLCFAKEHRRDKGRETDLCLPDCGKGAGTGTGAGKTRQRLENRDECVGLIGVLEAGNNIDMFG